MKKILPLIAALCFAGLSHAQETFDMPGATATYLTGINDSGAICGYYTTASATIGFEIDVYGDTIVFTGPGSSNAYVTANGISNKGLVVGNYNSTNTTSSAQGYIFYPNAGRNAGGICTNVTSGWGGTYIQASGIADDTCIAGNFQNGTTQDGALWCQGYTQENDLVCYSQSTRYPTYGEAVDKNSNVGGFIIQGAQEQCAIYRGAASGWDTFMLSTTKSRIYGMNDNSWICGTLVNNGTTEGYFAQKLAGHNASNITKINIKGATATYPMDINNSNNVVGYYTDAAGKTHGFIIANYDIGLRPSIYSWSCNNSAACAWPASYYGQYSYARDPITGDTFPRAKNGGVISNLYYMDWPDFVKALPGTAFYVTKQGKQVLDYNMYLRWAAIVKAFNGACYGFAQTAGLTFERPAGLLALYPNLGLYQGMQLKNYPINDTTLQAIIQVFTKQYSKESQAVINHNQALSVAANVQLIMQELRDSRGNPHHALGIVNQYGSGGHAVFPYKLVMDPGGNGIDSVYIYDCNYPGSNSQYVVINLNTGQGAWSYTGFNPTWGGANGKGFLSDGPDTIMLQPNLHVWGIGRPVAFPPDIRSVDDSIFAMYNDSSIVQMTDDSGEVALFSIDTTVTTGQILAATAFGGQGPEENKRVFSTNNVTIVSKLNHPGFANNFLQITQDGYVIRCDRVSGTDTTDNYAYSPGSLTYLDSGNASHTVGFTVAIDEDSNEYNYFINQLSVPVNNKVTVSLYGTNGMVLQNFGPATTYVITTEFVIDSVRYFTDTITIGSNTQHIIQPHDTTYSGIYILVDTGMTGHYEDTIFIHSTINDINRINAPNITAWPMPGGDQLFMSGPQGLITYTIVDMLGRPVATGQMDFGNGETRAFNLVNLTPGMYIINGTGQNQKWNYMFMKQ